MLPFTLTDVIVGFFVTWMLGLTPAFIARRRNCGPLARGTANWIAATSCMCLALLFFLIKISLGVPHPRFSAAWILVFLVSRWIMVRDLTEREAAFASTPSPRVDAPERHVPLTRQQIVQKLDEIASHPETPDEQRTWAREKLKAFARHETDRAPMHGPRRLLRLTVSKVRGQYARKAAYILVAAVALDVLLTASGYRLLLREKLVEPGQSYEARDWGDLGSFGKPVLACWYWTGRNVIPEAFWYGHGKHDRDECSTLHKHKPAE